MTAREALEGVKRDLRSIADDWASKAKRAREDSARFHARYGIASEYDRQRAEEADRCESVARACLQTVQDRLDALSE